jgi:hypothetical protein
VPLNQPKTDMPLIKCKECGGQVSAKAQNCPHCGGKLPKKTSMLTWIIGGCFAAALGAGIIQSNQEAQHKQAVEAAKSPEQRAAEAQAKATRDAQAKFAVTAIQGVRAAMKDPDSFRLVDAILMDDGTLCMTDRAKNSFNATVTDNIAVLKNFKTGVWNKTCGGKTGKNMNYVM